MSVTVISSGLGTVAKWQLFQNTDLTPGAPTLIAAI